MTAQKRAFNAPYKSQFTDKIAFPLGGIGAGMIAIEGTGAFSHVSLRHNPEMINERKIFAAVSAKSTAKNAKRAARVIEGPVPTWKYFGMPFTGTGGKGKLYGLPRFDNATFTTRFPFADIEMRDDEFPLEAALTAWSPFTPPDADSSSLPCAGLEYTLSNTSKNAVDAVFSFHAENFMKMPPRTDGSKRPDNSAHVDPLPRGFAVCQDAPPDEPHAGGAFAATLLEDKPIVNCAWFRGAWFDAVSAMWRSVETGATPSGGRIPDDEEQSAGGSLYLPLKLAAGESRKITVLLSWFVPRTNLQYGPVPEGAAPEHHQPWYASQFESIKDVETFWRKKYAKLRAASETFANAFYDSTLPPEIVEAAAANLSILKSPTVLRQRDGRM